MSEETRRRIVSEGFHDLSSVVKETPSQETVRLYEFGPFRLDPAERKLWRGNQIVALTPKAFDTLQLLVRNSGRVLEKDDLIRMLWPDTFVEEGSLSNHIFLLRKALGEDPGFIETVPRRGYRFIGAVRQFPHAAPNLEEPLHGHRRSDEVSAGQRVCHDSSIPVAVERQERSLGKDLLKCTSAVTAVAAVMLVSAAVWYRQPVPPTVINVSRITNDGKAKVPTNLPVTNGVHLYFIEGMPWTTGSGIAQQSVAGGETTWITTTLQEAFAIYDISPDRAEMLVARGVPVDPAHTTELWVQPLPAGAPHRVGNIVASSACWTPDGRHIVYGDGHAISMTNKDGSEPRQMATVSGVVRGLRFSPDGRRIRFYVIPSRANFATSIWEMDTKGRDIHPLLPYWKESPSQCCGNWSPDGNYYYFQGGQGDGQAIWVLPERHSFFRRAADRPWRLISGPLRFSAPAPSADGKRLFVVGEERRVELFRYDQRARRFDSYLPGFSAGPVDFSFDRKWMAYISYPEMTLWRSRVDGGEKTQLTFPPVRAYEPRWSPDGSKIAFTDVQPKGPWKISMLSSSGGNPEFLVQAGVDEAEASPTWTPDGKSIVFSKLNETGHEAIYRLELGTQRVFFIAGSDGIYSPRVSPDGRYISALTIDQTKLMLFDTSTNHWSSLVARKQLGYNEWSHDGKYIYFRQIRDGAGELVRVRIKDRALEDILSLKDFPQLTDIFASWIGLTPDGAPLLMRDRSVQEIYALDLRFH